MNGESFDPADESRPVESVSLHASSSLLPAPAYQQFFAVLVAAWLPYSTAWRCCEKQHRICRSISSPVKHPSSSPQDHTHQRLRVGIVRLYYTTYESMRPSASFHPRQCRPKQRAQRHLRFHKPLAQLDNRLGKGRSFRKRLPTQSHGGYWHQQRRSMASSCGED